MKPTIRKTLQILAMATLPATVWADGPLDITQLSKNNTLVRISGDESLLILPVQESMPDCKVQVLLNGRLEDEFYVRLADSNIDYSVPLDLTPYKGKGELMLNIKSETDRSHSREASEFVCWDEMRLSDEFDTSNHEKYRPVYHHTPLYGWMNDPNGMFYKDGEWHLCYQWNPYGSKWQNMTWGHSKSTDLINWEHAEPAIHPDALGTIFSGSAVVDANNTAGFGNDAVVAIYTSDGINQLQSLAYSTDGGNNFVKLNSNPIITTSKEARDPNMFWNPEIGRWNLILASPLEHEMLIFSSDDLQAWTLESSFGKGYGCQDGVWECPDLIKMPVHGTNEDKWVLICNINPGGPFGGSATQYFVGDFDGKVFKCDSDPSFTKWMDYGKDHYATVSWRNAPDDRHSVIGWMSNWEYANDVPTMQYRSANSLPREIYLFKATDGEIYLASTPSPELVALRGSNDTNGAVSLTSGNVHYTIPELCEIVLDVELAASADLSVTLSNEKGEKVEMDIDCAHSTFSMDRTASGIVDFSKHFPVKTVAPIYFASNDKKNMVTLRIFIDKCSIEAFVNDGKAAMTNLVFPTAPYDNIALAAHGGKAKIKAINIYELTKK